MLDIKLIREDVESVIAKLNTRGEDYSYLKEVIELDKERRELIFKGDEIKKERNQKSKQIGIKKSKGEDIDGLLNEVSGYGDKISELDLQVKEIDHKILDILNNVPNIPHESVTIGLDETNNREIKKVGRPRDFQFTPKAHHELGVELDILDFERASKITGSRFVVYKGLGARLERALITFMMDLHSNEHGYKEVIPPYIVNKDSLYGTGQLPKFENDLFKLNDTQDWYLNPTAEVPTINMYRDEILDLEKLPIKHVSYTTAFRSEAGSAGRDTRGILRQHQFNKVELIKLTTPEDSYKELEKMLLDSEKVLKLLELPYRVVSLCTGDLGFGANLTYDIEVWVPSQNTYREIASISNCEDFQSRRANIKFKRDKDSATELVHTLNGSGLAVGRTFLALIENYQNEDGTIDIPKVLVPYMCNIDKIKKEL